MKPTEQEIIDAAENASTNRFSLIKGNHFRDIAMEEAAFTDGHIAGAQWAISQMQPEWVSVATMTIEQKTKFNRYDPELIICRFDNGKIMRFNEDDHPFATITDVYFVPSPPNQ